LSSRSDLDERRPSRLVADGTKPGWGRLANAKSIGWAIYAAGFVIWLFGYLSALDPLVVDCPARLAQQFGDLAVAIAAVLPSKLDNIGGETLLVLTTARDLALCRAMLPERRTGATRGDMQLRSHLLNAGTATRGA
jgi:hypothetical protein